MNRGIAKRPIFENRADIRAFLARLAAVAKDGRLEVHAFSILTTHFHLLVRSQSGTLSSAMQSVQNEYSRWFNRTRRRDGPLFRGRFFSKVVDSDVYQRHLVNYIDANPVAAGLAATAALYPHGSARCYARLRGPPWLNREWIERCVISAAGRTEYDPADYSRVFGGRISERLRRLVERRIELATSGLDPLDDLIGAAPERVAQWMRRKSELADGTRIGVPVCDEEVVDEVIAAARAEQGEWWLPLRRKSCSAWELAHVACLRDLCGTHLAEVARRTGTTVSGAWSRYSRHQGLMVIDPAYAARVGALAQSALDRCHRYLGA